MAKKQKTVYFCEKCGNETPKWLGQCPVCKEWNTLVEQTISTKSSNHKERKLGENIKPLLLSEISVEETERIYTYYEEIDRVLGGGIVRGSLILVGGDPGIGKSTLLLQVSKTLAHNKNKVIYISGEESLKQIKLRANRMGEFSGELLFLCETDVDMIETIIKEYKPDMVVIDSIQTMYRDGVSSSPGSVTQVRETTNALMLLAKGLGVAIFIVGHVTKEGVVAGPRVLEHMVDTVLYFEGERHVTYRILRSVKNRFGSTNEIGVFEMCSEGLREVKNPSEYMLSGKPKNASGSVVACIAEGTRPILIEIQALICRTNFGIPRRTATGVDYNRVNLLMAVLEKRMGINLSDCDAYINITGGIKIAEPALDLAIVVAIISSYKDIIVDNQTIFFGEVGLSGEVRGVNMAEQRIKEAVKLGFKRCILPSVNVQKIEAIEGLELIGINNVKEITAKNIREKL
jgi:DNA repair protein RadA